MLNVILAGDHLYGKLLFTLLSLVMSLTVSFLCSPFFHEMSRTELSLFLRIFMSSLL